jgi:hypothetical protein
MKVIIGDEDTNEVEDGVVTCSFEIVVLRFAHLILHLKTSYGRMMS